MDTPHSARDGSGWSDGRCLLVLLGVALFLRLWQVTHTEVPARDSIGYIRIAWQIEHLDPGESVRGALQHPGYPVAILGMAHLIRPFWSGDEALLMQLSAQAVSSLASILMMIPLFYLGKDFLGRRAGFWGALLFQSFPAVGRLMGDGLSEGVFLLFASLSLLCANRALRSGALLPFALTGVTGGLAYLTRPEGLLIVAATGAVLLIQQLLPRWRRSWGRLLVQSGTLGMAAAALAAPFILVVGHVTTKPTPRRLIEGDQHAALTPPRGASARVAGHSPLAVWWEGEEDAPIGARYGWGAATLVRVLVRGFFHVGWVPALLALWWRRDQLRSSPGLWVQAIMTGILLALLFRVAVQIGYLSDRHTVLILLCGAFWSAAGLIELGERLGPALARWRPASGRWWPGPQGASLVLLLALTMPAMGRCLKPLHADREGFREAGTWLARNVLPGDLVIDPYCWAHFYAGRVFLEQPSRPLACQQPPVAYLVYEKSRNPHSRLKEVQRVQDLIPRARLVQTWSVSRGEVQIYAVPLNGIAAAR